MLSHADWHPLPAPEARIPYAPPVEGSSKSVGVDTPLHDPETNDDSARRVLTVSVPVTSIGAEHA